MEYIKRFVHSVLIPNLEESPPNERCEISKIIVFNLFMKWVASIGREEVNVKSNVISKYITMELKKIFPCLDYSAPRYFLGIKFKGNNGAIEFKDRYSTGVKSEERSMRLNSEDEYDSTEEG